MTSKITGYQNRPVQVGTEKKVSSTSDATATAVPSAASGSSPVRITDQARQLAALEQALQDLPSVNSARVAEIRLAIEEGRYQVNSEHIADKLLRLERELSL